MTDVASELGQHEANSAASSASDSDNTDDSSSLQHQATPQIEESSSPKHWAPAQARATQQHGAADDGEAGDHGVRVDSDSNTSRDGSQEPICLCPPPERIPRPSNGETN